MKRCTSVFRSCGIEVELPDTAQGRGSVERRSVGALKGSAGRPRPITPVIPIPQRLERIHHAVACREEHQRAAIDVRQGGRRPGAVKDVGRDVLVVPREQAAGVLVEHDQAWGVGGADAPMGVVHTCARVEVQAIAVDQDAAMGGIVRPNARTSRQVELPDSPRGHTAGCLLLFGLRTSAFGFPPRAAPRGTRPRRGC